MKKKLKKGMKKGGTALCLCFRELHKNGGQRDSSDVTDCRRKYTTDDGNPGG